MKRNIFLVGDILKQLKKGCTSVAVVGGLCIDRLVESTEAAKKEG